MFFHLLIFECREVF